MGLARGKQLQYSYPQHLNTGGGLNMKRETFFPDLLRSLMRQNGVKNILHCRDVHLFADEPCA